MKSVTFGNSHKLMEVNFAYIRINDEVNGRNVSRVPQANWTSRIAPTGQFLSILSLRFFCNADGKTNCSRLTRNQRLSLCGSLVLTAPSRNYNRDFSDIRAIGIHSHNRDIAGNHILLFSLNQHLSKEWSEELRVYILFILTRAIVLHVYERYRENDYDTQSGFLDIR